METIANTNIELKDTISNLQKEKIEEIFDKVYVHKDFINKIGSLKYRGDMGCLCVLGTRVVKNLIKNNLISMMAKYEICSERTGYKEDMLDED